jgi:hypothetical protein
MTRYAPTGIQPLSPAKPTSLTLVQTQLPPDYIDLEKRVDALKQAHQKLLTVTCVDSPASPHHLAR